MEIDVNEVLRDERFAVSFDFLDFEYWTVDLGLKYLAGIHKYYESFSLINLSENDDESHISVTAMSGEEYNSESDPDEIEAFHNRLNQLQTVWDKDKHQDQNPPEYYIQWAKDKAQPVYWFKNAIKQYRKKRPKEWVNRFNGDLQQKVFEQDKISKRIDEIVRLIDELGFPRDKIKRGGKSKVKAVCLKRPDLFTESTFKKAWQAGLDNKKFRMLDHDKFSN